MEFEIGHCEGVEFLKPKGLELPLHLDQFPDSCGPGNGLEEKLIPEVIWGLRVSPACWIHDRSWEYSKPCLEDFHISNAMFAWNLFSLIQEFPSRIWVVNAVRFYRATTYFVAVNGPLGRECFEKEKGCKL